MKRLAVDWDDSVLLARWQDIEDIRKKQRQRSRVRSVGYVLADNKHGVILAASVHGGQAAGVTVIPIGQVRRKRRVK